MGWDVSQGWQSQEKSEHKFMVCPLLQLLANLGGFSAAPAVFRGLVVSFSTSFYLPYTALHAAISSVFITQLCEVGTHCTDENTKFRKASKATQLAWGRQACSLASV